MAEKPVLLRVKFSYKPANNDELKLEKGDIITLTQKEEGGWWEGTLNGRTGWFPSNYVVEYVSPSTSMVVDSGEPGQTSSVNSSPSKSVGASNNGGQQQQQAGANVSTPSSNSSSIIESPAKKPLARHEDSTNTTSLISLTSFNSRSTISNEEQIQYRRMILTDLIETETAHISELQATWENILQHLPKAGILTPTEYKILVGNLVEIIQVLTICVLNPVKAEQCKPVKEQRIGKIFLDNAPKLESAHKNYCSNHPRAVQIIEKHKEQLGIFVEGRGNKTPGILHLITVLSQPFRRLEKYPVLLLELERNVDESHKDRGDLQRSIEYYKELDKACIDIRKQKEMELEVLSGAIIGWEGTDISQLGEIVHMHLVHIGQENEPRYFVLFTNTLLILSYDLEKSSLTYEGKIPVSGITLTQLADKERYSMSNAFEIAGPMIDSITVSCSTKQGKDAWIHHINKILKANRYPSFGSSPQQSFDQLTPPIQAWNISRLRPAPPFNPFLHECLAIASKASNLSNGKLGIGNHGKSLSNCITTYPQLSNEEDFTLLSVVDSFCNKSRQLSVTQDNIVPSPVISGKPVNGISTHSNKPRAKTLAEHVHALHDEVAGLKTNISSLTSQLDEEQSARKGLQLLVHNLMVKNGTASITPTIPTTTTSASTTNSQSQKEPVIAATTAVSVE